jgi:HlyD family secretion protein
VFANNDLYIQEIIATPLTRVNAGDEIFISSLTSLTSPVNVPIFLAPSDATQVFPGMRVLATPAGLDRAQYGGIVGQVKWVAKLPSSPSEVAARVGLPGVADLIDKRVGIPTEAVIALDRDPANASPGFSGGYRWSTKGQPPYRIKPGDVLEVEITTRRVRPIELVLPFLKKTFGFSPRYPKAEEKV